MAYYDGMIEIDLGQIKPMIAMPFHPSNTYTIEELNANLMDILDDCEKRAEVSFDGAVKLDLKSKVRNGKLYVDQGIIAGCAGGGFENICDAADILKGASIGPDEFTLSVYPASTPIYMELVKNGAVASLMETKERSSKQRSAVLALVPEILLQTTHSPSATLQETSRTAKVPRSRRDRLHPLRLWMQDPLQQLQQIRDI